MPLDSYEKKLSGANFENCTHTVMLKDCKFILCQFHTKIIHVVPFISNRFKISPFALSVE